MWEIEPEQLEGEDEEDRIWEAMRQEILEDSTQPIHLDYEGHEESLKMWDASAQAHEANLFGREMSYEETNENIFRKEILV